MISASSHEPLPPIDHPGVRLHRNEVPSYLFRLTGCKNFAFSCWGGNDCLQFTLGANEISPIVTIDTLQSTSTVDKSSECFQKCLRRLVTHKVQVNYLSDSTNKNTNNDKELLHQIPEKFHEVEPLHLKPAPQGCQKIRS